MTFDTTKWYIKNRQNPKKMRRINPLLKIFDTIEKRYHAERYANDPNGLWKKAHQKTYDVCQELIKNPYTDIEINWQRISEKDTSYINLVHRVIPKLPKLYYERLDDIDIQLLGYLLFCCRNSGLKKEEVPLEKQLLPKLRASGSGWWNACSFSMDDLAQKKIIKTFAVKTKQGNGYASIAVIKRHMNDLAKMGLFSKRQMPQTMVTGKTGAEIKWNPNCYFLKRPLLFALVRAFHTKYNFAFNIIARTKEYVEERTAMWEKAVANDIERATKQQLPTIQPLTPETLQKDWPEEKRKKYGIRNWVQYTDPKKKPFIIKAYQKSRKEEGFINNLNTIQQLDKLRLLEIAKAKRLSWTIFSNPQLPNWKRMPAVDKQTGKRFTFINIAKYLVNDKPFPYLCKKYASYTTQQEIENNIVDILKRQKINTQSEKIKKKIERAKQYIFGCYQDFIPRNRRTVLSVIDSKFKEITDIIILHVFRKVYSVNKNLIIDYINSRYTTNSVNYSPKRIIKKAPDLGSGPSFIQEDSEEYINEGEYSWKRDSWDETIFSYKMEEEEIKTKDIDDPNYVPDLEKIRIATEEALEKYRKLQEEQQWKRDNAELIQQRRQYLLSMNK